MEIEIGKVTHFFNGISVAVIELTDTLKVGDTVHIKGATTDFVQKVESMEINHQKVKEAGYGESIGLKVKERVREGDKVYKVVEEAVKPELEAKKRAGKAEKAEKAGAEKAEKRKRGRPKKKK
jgi:putative protease